MERAWGKRETAFASIDRSVERWLKYVCSLGYSAVSLHSAAGECISVSYRTANRRIRPSRNALWPCSTLLYTAWIKLNRSVQPRNEGRSANPLAIRFAIVRPTERTLSLSASILRLLLLLLLLSPCFFLLPPRCRLVINLIFHRVITGRLMAATSYFFFVSIFPFTLDALTKFLPFLFPSPFSFLLSLFSFPLFFNYRTDRSKGKEREREREREREEGILFEIRKTRVQRKIEYSACERYWF